MVVFLRGSKTVGDSLYGLCNEKISSATERGISRKLLDITCVCCATKRSRSWDGRMGSAESHDQSHGSSVVRIVRAGGKVEVYFEPVTAEVLMLRNPKHLVARPEVFRSDVEKALMPPEALLMPGKKFYLIPCHTVEQMFLQRERFSKLSGQSSSTPHSPGDKRRPGMSISPRHRRRRRGEKGRAGKSPSRSSAERGDGGHSGTYRRESAGSIKKVAARDQSATTCRDDATLVEGSWKKTNAVADRAGVEEVDHTELAVTAAVEEVAHTELTVRAGGDQKIGEVENDLSEYSERERGGVSRDAEAELLVRKNETRRSMTLGQHLRSSMSLSSEASPYLSVNSSVDSELQQPCSATVDKNSEERLPDTNKRSLKIKLIKPLMEEKVALIQNHGTPSRTEFFKQTSKTDPNRDPKLGSVEGVEKTLSDHFSKQTTIGSEIRRGNAQRKTIAQPATSAWSSSYWSPAVTDRKPRWCCCHISRQSGRRRQHPPTLGINSLKRDDPSINAKHQRHKRVEGLPLPSLIHRTTPPSTPPGAARTPSPDRFLNTMIAFQPVEQPPAPNLLASSSPQLTSQLSPVISRPLEQLFLEQSLSSSPIRQSQNVQSGALQARTRPVVYRRARMSAGRVKYINRGRLAWKPLSPILETSPECLAVSMGSQ